MPWRTPVASLLRGVRVRRVVELMLVLFVAGALLVLPPEEAVRLCESFLSNPVPLSLP